jgi:hypothetical protein
MSFLLGWVKNFLYEISGLTRLQRGTVTRGKHRARMIRRKQPRRSGARVIALPAIHHVADAFGHHFVGLEIDDP